MFRFYFVNPLGIPFLFAFIRINAISRFFPIYRNESSSANEENRFIWSKLGQVLVKLPNANIRAQSCADIKEVCPFPFELYRLTVHTQFILTSGTITFYCNICTIWKQLILRERNLRDYVYSCWSNYFDKIVWPTDLNVRSMFCLGNICCF